jgi:hypothetical protein
MKAIKSLVVAAVAAAGVAVAVDAQAAGPVRSGGHWSGGGGHWSGGHWGGGHWGGRYWYPRVGFYVGAPLLWSAWYWGWPYDYYYPRTVVYDRVIERYPAAYPDGVMEPGTEVAPSKGAPTQGPLYMNYCDSARAYYPKVTSCPEGWKFIAPSR